jgi:hypothetical protein
MPHRSDSSHASSRRRNPDYYDDVQHHRPQSRHGHRHPHHHHRPRSGSFDDLEAHKHSGGSHRSSTSLPMPSYQPHTYDRSKTTDPSHPHGKQHRHSSYGLVARGHHDENDSISGDEPPRHAHISRSGRHSTFPPSAYQPSPLQTHVQPYQPYVHPALPPQSPHLAPYSAGGVRPVQYTPRPGLAYEPPSYTYQPPAADPPRPQHPVRAESWGHSTRSESGSDRSARSFRSSKSLPPASRSIQDDARERVDDTPHGPWEKAKKAYKSKTVNNSAELAMFGLLALSKAL